MTGTYSAAYSERRFWNKIGRVARAAGADLAEKALCLYYVVSEGNAPVWARTAALGALGYLLSPIDAIPDLTPVLGYTDDLAVITAALATLTVYVTPEIREKAAVKVADWLR